MTSVLVIILCGAGVVILCRTAARFTKIHYLAWWALFALVCAGAVVAKETLK